MLTHNTQVWEIVVLQAISGTASAFFNPASTAVLGTSETLCLAAGGTVVMVIVAIATPSVRRVENASS